MSKAPGGDDGRDLTLLSRCARAVLAALSLAAFYATWSAWTSPPQRRQFAAQCFAPDDGTRPAAENCVGQVSADTSAFVVALFGAGVAFVVLAVNGRRLQSVKAGGQELSFDGERATGQKIVASLKGKLTAAESKTESSEPKSDVAEPIAAARGTVTVDGQEMDVYSLEDLRPFVLLDLLTKLNENDLLPKVLDVEFIARHRGRGNHPWYVKFRESQIWRVSYGGQAKTGPSIEPVGE
jgi:hypothetical protein